MPFLIINKMFKIKGDLIELIFSCIIILLTITLIILIISLTVKKPKVLSEYKVKIKTIIGLESLDFIDNISIPEYPHANLGLTGKLILDCYTGTCIKEIIHKDTYTTCSDHRDPCSESLIVWTEYRPIIDHFCSEQCYEYKSKECNCTEEFHKKGTCEHKMDDYYIEGKICFAYNTIYFWKGKRYEILKESTYNYLDNAILKDEECPKGTKYCGIIDGNENKLCIESNLKCPINYISDDETNSNQDYSSFSFGNKTFYYGYNDSLKDKKIVMGLMVETDLYLNEDKYEKEIIDLYNISEFLKDNQNLFKDINLGYDPYSEKDIDKKGNSYLKAFYNTEQFDLTDLRNTENKYHFNVRINKKAFNPIHKKTKIITILGLISCGYLFLAFLVILKKRKNLSEGYCGLVGKVFYCLFIIPFLILILPTLIYGCKNIAYIKEAKSIDPKGNYKTFQRINNAFVITGFILFSILIVFIILVPIEKDFECCKRKNKELKNDTTQTKVNQSNSNINLNKKN